MVNGCFRQIVESRGPAPPNWCIVCVRPIHSVYGLSPAANKKRREVRSIRPRPPEKGDPPRRRNCPSGRAAGLSRPPSPSRLKCAGHRWREPKMPSGHSFDWGFRKKTRIVVAGRVFGALAALFLGAGGFRAFWATFLAKQCNVLSAWRELGSGIAFGGQRRPVSDPDGPQSQGRRAGP